MNPFLRVGPYLYAALHSYNTVWELLLTRSERRDAIAGANHLRARYPFVGRYDSLAETFRAKISADYRTYTRTVSPDPIAISLELSVFLAVLCDAWRPSAILDLGSGFSSYVFRSYAKHANGDAAPVVYSIDHSSAWLEQTRRFLEERGLECSHLVTWNDFVANERPAFDLVLLDMADLGTRLEMLDTVVGSCRPGGMIVIDDMHVPGYRKAILRHLAAKKLECLSLRTFTRRRLRYSYVVLR